MCSITSYNEDEMDKESFPCDQKKCYNLAKSLQTIHGKKRLNQSKIVQLPCLRATSDGKCKSHGVFLTTW